MNHLWMIIGKKLVGGILANAKKHAASEWRRGPAAPRGLVLFAAGRWAIAARCCVQTYFS
jgi:hypothetical protein